MVKRLEAAVRGRVQMVMFRDFVQRRARRLGLAGWVRNETDGTVRLVAEGEALALEKLLCAVRRGSFLSRVDEVQESWHSPQGEKPPFIIRY